MPPPSNIRDSRIGHAISALPDGRVLITGGSHTLSTADSFVWTATTGDSKSVGLSPRREAHTATSLADGRVLLAGGIIARYEPASVGRRSLKAAALFDPAANQLRPTGEMNFDRNHHSATLLDDGRVLVVGGTFIETTADRRLTGHAITTAELWNPTTGQWTETAGLHHARFDHVAERLPDGRVLVAGGMGLKGALASAEIWDPATGAWIEAAPMQRARFGHASTPLRDGRILVIGGRSMAMVEIPGGKKVPADVPTWTTELYDPAANRWVPGPRLTVARSELAVVTLPDQAVLVLGGLSAPEDPAEAFSGPGKLVSVAISERWSPGEARFSPAPRYELAYPRTQARAVRLPDARILVFGGISGDGMEWELLPNTLH